MYKRRIFILALFISIQSSAQFPIAQIIQAGITKVIKAVDLKIQKLQNKTLVLQNAQSVIQNQMLKVKLTEISDWVNKQKELYKNYFDELRKVKTAITYYHKVKDLIEDQDAMIGEYKQAWSQFRQDKKFSPDELDFMSKTYTGDAE
jgi:hypothetical protein